MKRMISCMGIILTTLLLALSSSPLRAATVTVTEATDGYNGNICTLRNAIESVNHGVAFGGCVFDLAQPFGTNDTIRLTAQTYTLSVDGPDEEDNQSGDLDVLVSLTLVGAGSNQTQISAAGFSSGQNDRVLHVWNDGTNPLVNLQNLSLQNGQAYQDEIGGGLLIGPAGSGTVRLENVLVSNNSSNNGGGGIANASRAFSLGIFSSEISMNRTARTGGGLANRGFAYIDSSTVEGNEAFSAGGGIDTNNTLLVTNSTLSDNRAFYDSGFEPPVGNGGAIYTSAGPTLLVNSTISNNLAANYGGGVMAVPGRPTNELNFVGFYNVTVTDNEAQNNEAGGVCFNCNPVIIGPAGTTGIESLQVYNSLIARNQAPVNPDCSGAFTSGDFNLIGDNTGCDGFTQPGDQTNVAAPGLDTGLALNGGLTATVALLTGSPAIDAGNNAEGCLAPDVKTFLDSETLSLVPLTQDQRGFPRPTASLDPNNPICDIGAFELGAVDLGESTFDLSVTKTDGLNGQTVSVGDSFTYTIVVTNEGPGDSTDITLSDPLPTGMSFVAVTTTQGTCSLEAGTVECFLGILAADATATIEITVIPTEEGSYTNVATASSDEGISGTGQVTTTVTGGFLQGSGVSCGLGAGSPSSAPACAAALLLALACYFSARRKITRKP